MKSLAISDQKNWPRYVAHQISYSLAVRDYEWELGPLAKDQGVGAVAYSPLAGSALTGKLRRGQVAPAESRLRASTNTLMADEESIYTIVDALDEISSHSGRPIAQIALNWLLERPTISSVVFGARNAEQLESNIGATQWKLSAEEIALLDKASERPMPYPYSHQMVYPQFQPK